MDETKFKINDRVVIISEYSLIKDKTGIIISKNVDLDKKYVVSLDVPDGEMNTICLSEKDLQISDSVKKGVVSPKILLFALYALVAEFGDYVEIPDDQKLTDLSGEIETLRLEFLQLIDMSKESNGMLTENKVEVSDGNN